MSKKQFVFCVLLLLTASFGHFVHSPHHNASKELDEIRAIRREIVFEALRVATINSNLLERASSVSVSDLDVCSKIPPSQSGACLGVLDYDFIVDCGIPVFSFGGWFYRAGDTFYQRVVRSVSPTEIVFLNGDFYNRQINAQSKGTNTNGNASFNI